MASLFKQDVKSDVLLQSSNKKLTEKPSGLFGGMLTERFLSITVYFSLYFSIFLYTLFLGDKKIRNLLGESTKRLSSGKLWFQGNPSRRGPQDLALVVGDLVPALLAVTLHLHQGRTRVIPQGFRIERGEAVKEMAARRMEQRNPRRTLVNLKV